MTLESVEVLVDCMKNLKNYNCMKILANDGI